MMPEMDGIEATQIIRRLGYERPIVALTANAVAGQKEIFMKNGFEDAIFKPIDLRELNGILLKYVRNKQPAAVIEEARKNFEEMKSDMNTVAINQATKYHFYEVEGLSLAKGLDRYNGDEDTYLKVMRSYISSVKTMLDHIEIFDEANLHDYKVKVHGIKGASYDIFADEIAKKASRLEQAANEKNIAYITANHLDLMTEARNFILMAEEMLQKAVPKITKPVRKKIPSDLLEMMRIACRDYDMDAADHAMQEIEKYDYDSDKELAIWLRDAIDLLSFSEIYDRLSKG